MVAALLARRLHAPGLSILTIPGGVDPEPAALPISTVDPRLLGGAPALITLADIFDLAARGRLDTAFLGGVQIDRRGPDQPERDRRSEAAEGAPAGRGRQRRPDADRRAARSSGGLATTPGRSCRSCRS